MIRLSARSPLRCAFCHADAVGAVACAGCGTLMHPECSAEVGKCPTLGCAERPAMPHEPTAEPQAVSWWLSGWVAEQVCVAVVVLGIVFAAAARKFNELQRPNGQGLDPAAYTIDTKITDKIR